VSACGEPLRHYGMEVRKEDLPSRLK
jgi:hypothetical protein